jgi:hypothetical protein
MTVYTARQYPGTGSIAAVVVGGTRYALRSDGRPENPQLNQRAARRVRFSRERHAIPALPEPAPVPSIDDFEPRLGASFLGSEAELLGRAWDEPFTFDPLDVAGDRADWNL